MNTRIWLLCALGRNPLVRRTDRLEAVVIVLLSVILILLVPVAGAVGTGVHESQSAHLAKAIASRHQTTALVTADSTGLPDPYSAGSVTPVRWTAGGETYQDVVQSREWRKAGDTMSVWVDDLGRSTLPPPTPTDAALGAVIAAGTTWTGAAATAAMLLVLLRRRLNRQRYALWEREYERLADDDKKRHQW